MDIQPGVSAGGAPPPSGGPSFFAPEFHGRLGELYGIYIRNLLLSILTLGVGSHLGVIETKYQPMKPDRSSTGTVTAVAMTSTSSSHDRATPPLSQRRPPGRDGSRAQRCRRPGSTTAAARA